MTLKNSFGSPSRSCPSAPQAFAASVAPCSYTEPRQLAYTKISINLAQSDVNATLDGSTYPGYKKKMFYEMRKMQQAIIWYQ